MPSDGKTLLAAFKKADKALVAEGFHATSPQWMEALRAFWIGGKPRFTVRKGRQSGFSTTMARVGAVTARFGKHAIARGSRGVFVFISVRQIEADERLHNCAEILSALKIPYRRSGETIELTGTNFIIQSYPCSVRVARGMTAIDVVEDEVAFMRDDNGANPAAELDASLVSAGITQPNFRIYSGSSPVGDDDFHARMYARGDTDDQCVAEGPSWFWNPSITEEATRTLQPDFRIWQREFAAIPQAGLLAAFDVNAFDLCRADGARKLWMSS